MEHTKEPWHVGGQEEGKHLIYGTDGWCVAEVKPNKSNREANASRIVACVNAFAGVSDETLAFMSIAGETLAQRLKHLINEANAANDVADDLEVVIKALAEEYKDAFVQELGLIPNSLAYRRAIALTASIEASHD